MNQLTPSSKLTPSGKKIKTSEFGKEVLNNNRILQVIDYIQHHGMVHFSTKSGYSEKNSNCTFIGYRDYSSYQESGKCFSNNSFDNWNFRYVDDNFNTKSKNGNLCFNETDLFPKGTKIDLNKPDSNGLYTGMREIFCKMTDSEIIIRDKAILNKISNDSKGWQIIDVLGVCLDTYEKVMKLLNSIEKADIERYESWESIQHYDLDLSDEELMNNPELGSFIEDNNKIEKEPARLLENVRKEVESLFASITKDIEVPKVYTPLNEEGNPEIEGYYLWDKLNFIENTYLTLKAKNILFPNKYITEMIKRIDKDYCEKMDLPYVESNKSNSGANEKLKLEGKKPNTFQGIFNFKSKENVRVKAENKNT